MNQSHTNQNGRKAFLSFSFIKIQEKVIRYGKGKSCNSFSENFIFMKSSVVGGKDYHINEIISLLCLKLFTSFLLYEEYFTLLAVHSFIHSFMD